MQNLQKKIGSFVIDIINLGHLIWKSFVWEILGTEHWSTRFPGAKLQHKSYPVPSQLPGLISLEFG